MEDVIVYLVLLAIYLLLSYGIGKAAQTRGRQFGSFFFLSIFLSPFIAYPVLLIAGSSQDARRGQGSLIACPSCDKAIESSSKFCRFCGVAVPK